MVERTWLATRPKTQSENRKAVEVPVKYTTLSMFEAQSAFWIACLKEGDYTGV